MKRTMSLAAATALAVAAGGGASAKANGGGYAGHELAGQAHITMAQARGIALKARPGRITDEELEKEGGGSGLRYSFDVRAAGHVFEVGVDASNGRVLENDSEGAHPD